MKHSLFFLLLMLASTLLFAQQKNASHDSTTKASDSITVYVGQLSGLDVQQLIKFVEKDVNLYSVEGRDMWLQSFLQRFHAEKIAPTAPDPAKDPKK